MPDETHDDDPTPDDEPQERSQGLLGKSFLRQWLDNRDQHSRDDIARVLQPVREAQAGEVTLERLQAAPPGSAEREVLLQRFAQEQLQEHVEDTGAPFSPGRAGLEVEVEPEPETTYREELNELKSAHVGDRERLAAQIIAKRLRFGGQQ